MTNYEKRSLELLEKIASDIKWMRKRAERIDTDKKKVSEFASEALKSSLQRKQDTF